MLSRVATNLVCRLGEATNRSFLLPLVIFYPTSRCNSRCLSCDWWKSTGEDDLTVDEIARLVPMLGGLGTRVAAFSGGEPLYREDIFDIAALFRAGGMRLRLLTSGVLLTRCAEKVAEYFDTVTISLDGSTAASYRAVRGVAGLEAIESGVRRLKTSRPGLPITARATLHAANYREMPQLIDKARALRLDGISFLGADISSDAFGGDASRLDRGLALDADQVGELRSVIERTIADYREDFASGFIAEPPDKLRRLPRSYSALRGGGQFPPVSCNAPWVSVVIEANGNVRPCYFHQPVGNVRNRSISQIIREDLPAFRRTLDVATNHVCQRCVCSLRVGLTSGVW